MSHLPHRIAGAAACVAAVVALAGCSSSSSKHSSGPAPSTSRSSGLPVSAAPSIAPDVTLAHSVGARRDLTKFSCTADGSGAWSAKGVVTNSQKTSETYNVQVNVVDTKGSTVLGRAQRSYVLASSATAHVSFPKFATAHGASCVVRVIRAKHS